MSITTKTKYCSSDGREFNSLKDAEEYERLDTQVQQIVDLLPCPRLNHGEGFRHPKSKYDEARSKATELIMDNGGLGKHTRDQVFEFLSYPLSSVHRWLSEDYRAIGKLGNKFMRINSDGVEYDQPYFNLNPSEAKIIN